jgi:hypothetical protein
MFLEPASRSVAVSDAVYTKTAKGRSEVASRGMGLSGRQRGVLIMLDGHKSCAALAPLMPAGQVAFIVEQLLALDLIAPCGMAGPAPVASGITPDDRRDDLDRIKRYMVSTAQAHLGLLAAGVVGRIECAADAAQLRAVVGHWHMALRDSKRGRATAEEHLREVRAGLRSAGIEA